MPRKSRLRKHSESSNARIKTSGKSIWKRYVLEYVYIMYGYMYITYTYICECTNSFTLCTATGTLCTDTCTLCTKTCTNVRVHVHFDNGKLSARRRATKYVDRSVGISKLLRLIVHKHLSSQVQIISFTVQSLCYVNFRFYQMLYVIHPHLPPPSHMSNECSVNFLVVDARMDFCLSKVVINRLYEPLLRAKLQK